jgi:hypothetical protein
MTLEKVDEVLTSQLYARIPLGSVTADHEIVKGVGRFAPAAGDSNAGVGTAAAAGLTAASTRARINRTATAGWIFIDGISEFYKGGRKIIWLGIK